MQEPAGRRPRADAAGDPSMARVCQAVRELLGPAASRRRHLVAVSGGIDSMVLLHALGAGLGWKRVVAVHVNHGLRGRISGADAAFVRRESARLGLACEVLRADVRTRARRLGESLETAARAERYAALAEAARRLRCCRILLAHHADDQAETVLMNLFRGAGSRGLAGMRPRSERAEGGLCLELWRPLLGLWRSEIDSAAAACGVRHREDSSNRSTDFLRNRVRRVLLPAIQQCFARDVRPLLVRTALQAADETDFFDALVAVPAQAETLETRALRQLHPAVRRRLLQAWLRNNGVPEPGFRLLESLAALVPPGAPAASVNLPGGRRARRRAGRLFLEPPAP